MNFQFPHIRTVDLLKPAREGAQGTLRVLTEDMEVYFVKAASTSNRKLINEYVCSRLLNLWGIPTPQIAAVQQDADTPPAFGSRNLGATTTELSSLYTLRSQTDLKRFANPADLFKLGLFDIWVENRGRKESRLNLLIHHERGYWKIFAIDHGAAFRDRPHADLNPSKGVTLAFRDSLLQSHLLRQVKLFFAKKGIGVFSRSYFFSLVDRCESQFDTLLSQTPETWEWSAEERRSVRKFLFDRQRNEAVYDDFLVKLQ